MSKLEQKLRAALRERVPSDDEKAHWARRAMDAPTKQSRALPAAIAVAATVLLAAGVWVATRGDDVEPTPRPNMAQDAVPTVDEQRAIHDAYLADDKHNVTVREAKRGAYVMIAGIGEDINVWTSDDPAQIQKLCSLTWPDSGHRYFFRKGPTTFPPTTIITQASPVKVGLGGAMFLQEIELRDPPPHIELEVGEKRVRTKFELNKESQATLVIPDALCDSRFEIPGSVILTNEHGVWLKCRRYFLRVRSVAHKIDRFAECAGKPDAVALDLHGNICHKLKRPEAEEAQDAPRGRPLLVIEAPVEQAGLVRDAFQDFKPGKADDGPMDKVRHVWKPGKKLRLRRYSPQGRLLEQIALSPEGARADVRRFLRWK